MLRFRFIAITAALIAFVLSACGDDDAGTTTTEPVATQPPATAPPATEPPQTPTTETPAAPPSADAPPQPTAAPATTTTTTTLPPTTTTTEPGPFRIVVNFTNGESDVEGKITVERGDEIEIVVAADIADEVHIHGYDYKADVTPTEPAVITFVADLPGIYEVEFEGTHALIFELEVR